LDNDLTSIFIFYNQFDIPVGIIRIQQINEKEAVISMSVDKNQRGKGIAKLISTIGSNYYKGLNTNIVIIAYIKASNLATINIYKNIGYREVESDLELGLKFIL
jgi:predicted GNAT family acetyltransferase